MWEGGREKWAGGSRWEGRAEFGTSGPEGHKGFEGFSQTADRANGGKKNTLSPFITASVVVLSLEGEVLHEPQRRFWLCYSNRLPLGRLARASVLANSCRGKLRNSRDSLSYQVPFSRDKRKQEGTVAEMQRFAGSEQQPC